MAMRDLTDLAKRWSAMSEVDRTATPACTPPTASPTHRGRKIFDLPGLPWPRVIVFSGLVVGPVCERPDRQTLEAAPTLLPFG